jgi:hypothetical protein
MLKCILELLGFNRLMNYEGSYMSETSRIPEICDKLKESQSEAYKKIFAIRFTSTAGLILGILSCS